METLLYKRKVWSVLLGKSCHKESPVRHRSGKSIFTSLDNGSGGELSGYYRLYREISVGGVTPPESPSSFHVCTLGSVVFLIVVERLDCTDKASSDFSKKPSTGMWIHLFFLSPLDEFSFRYSYARSATGGPKPLSWWSSMSKWTAAQAKASPDKPDVLEETVPASAAHSDGHPIEDFPGLVQCVSSVCSQTSRAVGFPAATPAVC
ncbi:hypothetical protein QBC35DRAFT_529553 [Podospora australis]|uniref:Uncharacterized protein n=1 Tax=Podospora australis TaxID=1536484 RepID=A0AAN6X3X7_9PEZI|nr:hypothetical protein QBC35DRAFT_529553 [Podospora australis]